MSILPLEQQVVSRELAEKLRDAGFPQDTHLSFCPSSGLMHHGEPHGDHIVVRGSSDDLAAPTTAELLEHLFILGAKEIKVLRCSDGGVVITGWPLGRAAHNGVEADTVAEALGLLALKVLEEEK